MAALCFLVSSISVLKGLNCSSSRMRILMPHRQVDSNSCNFSEKAGITRPSLQVDKFYYIPSQISVPGERQGVEQVRSHYLGQVSILNPGKSIHIVIWEARFDVHLSILNSSVSAPSLVEICSPTEFVLESIVPTCVWRHGKLASRILEMYWITRWRSSCVSR